MKIIDNVSSTYYLSEIGHGKREVQFAFINNQTGETITPFVRCKDYFNDMFYSNKVNKDLSIFGFKWKPNQDNGILDKNILTLAVRLRDKENNSKFYEITEEERASVLNLLNKISKTCGFGKVIVRHCDEKKNLIISFNKKWTELPYINSALYFFIRLGFTYKKREDVITWFDKADKFISPNDQTYFRSAKKKIEDLLKGKIDTTQKYEDYTTGNIHGSSGLVCYSKYNVIEG